jgi:hypothetical protein
MHAHDGADELSLTFPISVYSVPLFAAIALVYLLD